MDLKMKKATRVVIAGACAGALALGAALPAFAANTATTDTTVSYNTSTGTFTPNVGWQVFIPSSITFTATSTTAVPFQLKLDSRTSTPLASLTDLPGSTGAAGKGSVAVRAWSANTMQLKIAGAAEGQEDPLDYSIHLGTTDFSKGTPEIGTKDKGVVVATLDASNVGTSNVANGTATVSSLPQKDGNHTDTLTFAFWDGTGKDPYASV